VHIETVCWFNNRCTVASVIYFSFSTITWMEVSRGGGLHWVK